MYTLDIYEEARMNVHWVGLHFILIWERELFFFNLRNWLKLSLLPLCLEVFILA